MTKKRGNGEGGVGTYTTKAGRELHYIVYRAYDRDRGERRQVKERGFTTKRDALKALRERLTAIDAQAYTAPSKLTVAQFLETRWLPVLAGQVRTSTYASYERNLRLHVLPSIGAMTLRTLDAGADRALRSTVRPRAR